MSDWFVKDEREAGYRPVTLEAHDLVFGDRNASYGHPLDDFTCTAACWTAYLKHKTRARMVRTWKGEARELRRFLQIFDEFFSADAEDVGPMMIHVKTSRQANAPKRDSMADTAGYAETTERVIFERARRAEEAAMDGWAAVAARTENRGEIRMAQELGLSADDLAPRNAAGLFNPPPDQRPVFDFYPPADQPRKRPTVEVPNETKTVMIGKPPYEVPA